MRYLARISQSVSLFVKRKRSLSNYTAPIHPTSRKCHCPVSWTNKHAGWTCQLARSGTADTPQVVAFGSLAVRNSQTRNFFPSLERFAIQEKKKGFRIASTTSAITPRPRTLHEASPQRTHPLNRHDVRRMYVPRSRYHLRPLGTNEAKHWAANGSPQSRPPRSPRRR